MDYLPIIAAVALLLALIALLALQPEEPGWASRAVFVICVTILLALILLGIRIWEALP